MRLCAHAGALQRRLNAAAMPLPIEARNGRTAPPLGCKEKRHWPARRQTAGNDHLMIQYRCRAGASSSRSKTPAITSPSFRRPSMPLPWLLTDDPGDEAGTTPKLNRGAIEKLLGFF